jgi:hypothetical protein
MADTERTRREQLAIENARKDAAAVNMGKAYERSLTNTAPAPKEAASAPAKPPAKKACGGKVKKYAEGGVTEGENKNIDDDTRMRARAAIMRRLAGEEDEAPPVKRSAPKAVSKSSPPGPSGRPRDNVAPSGRGAAAGSFKDTVAESRASEVPKPMGQNTPAREESRLERFGRGAKELAEKTLPPLGIGAGIGAGIAGAQKLGKMYQAAKASKLADEAATQAATRAAARPREMIEDMARRAQELKESTARGAADRARLAAKREEAERRYDEMRSSDMEAGFKKGGNVKAYAKGGSVRGGGCESRGKTKGRFV